MLCAGTESARFSKSWHLPSDQVTAQIQQGGRHCPSRAPFVRETPPLWGSKIVIVSVPWCLEEPHIDDGIFKTDAAYQET